MIGPISEKPLVVNIDPHARKFPLVVILEKTDIPLVHTMAPLVVIPPPTAAIPLVVVTDP